MPGLTLSLDASANTGTIALLRDGLVIASREVAMRSSAEERFLPAILATLSDADTSLQALSRLACGAGPGSFTSLRVVAAVAKGLAEGLGLELFGMPSLGLIVASSDATREPASRWLATLDAMRGDRYVGLVTVGATGAVARVEALGLEPAAAIPARARELQATPIGPDESVTSAPHARGLERLAALVGSSGPVDLASWEPVYGRLAEAQVKWEVVHGMPLDAVRGPR